LWLIKSVLASTHLKSDSDGSERLSQKTSRLRSTFVYYNADTSGIMAERQGLEQHAFRLVRKHSLQVADDLPSNDVAQAVGDFETHERAAEAKDPARDWQRWLDFDESNT
jgi:hypothetical protein